MDNEQLVYELQDIEAMLRILTYLDTSVKGEDISRIAQVYVEKVEAMIDQIKKAIPQE